MLIVNLPIEDLDERYSKQWNEWFEIHSAHKQTLTIKPEPLSTTIREGGFLDVVGTMFFKSMQLAGVTDKIDDGEIPRDEKVVFLIQDGWFPVEQLAYIRDMLGCHYWKFVGIMHDGTYDKWDLTARNNMYTWGEDLENSWFKIYDAVVVGSNYHKRVLLETRKIPDHKIQVIPWHVEVPVLDTTHKENIIVFPHRLDEEKQPELFLQIADELRRPDWQWICTKEEKLNKQEYYQLLAKSKIAVSLSLLEMFGIAMVEATKLGCIPLVPNSLSYKEMYTDDYRYNDIKELKSKLRTLMDGKQLSTILSMPLRKNVTGERFFPDLFYLMEKL